MCYFNSVHITYGCCGFLSMTKLTTDIFDLESSESHETMLRIKGNYKQNNGVRHFHAKRCILPQVTFKQGETK